MNEHVVLMDVGIQAFVLLRLHNREILFNTCVFSPSI